MTKRREGKLPMNMENSFWTLEKNNMKPRRRIRNKRKNNRKINI
jgi:hypothetical protein